MRLETLNEYLKSMKHNQNTILFYDGMDKKICITYQELYETSLSYLGGLQALGVKQGDYVIFQLQKNYDFVIAFWACVLGGIVVVPVQVVLTEQDKIKLEKIEKCLGQAIILKNQEISLKTEKNRNQIIDFESIFLKKSGIIAEVDFADTVFIQFSSGTTGDPKGVILNHKNLVCNADAILQGIGVDEKDKSLSWMPLTHDLGLIGFHITPLIAGVNQVLMKTELFLKCPTLWMDLVHNYKSTIISSPNFGLQLFLKQFEQENDYGWDFSNVRFIFNGAEPVSNTICDIFINLMKQYRLGKNVMFPVYGLAEATLAVTFPVPHSKVTTICVNRDYLNVGDKVEFVDTSYNNGMELVNLGRCVKYVKMRVTDDDGQILSEGMIGNIEICGESICSGYYNNSEASKQLFSADGWMKTGDIGMLHENNLYLTGRKKDVIFVHGKNYYSVDIENCIHEICGKTAIVCAIPNKEKKDDVIVFIETEKSGEVFVPMANYIKNEIALRLRIPIRYCLPCSKSYRTASGKIMRHPYIEDYQRGKYAYEIALQEAYRVTKKAEVSVDETEKKLIQMFSEILERDNIAGDDNFIALGGDSIKVQTLIAKIMESFHVNLKYQEIATKLTPNLLTECIKTAETMESNSGSIRASYRDIYPMLPPQEHIYILSELDATKHLFDIEKCYRIISKKGRQNASEMGIDIKRLEWAVNQLVKKYEILRTTFDYEGNQFVQKVHETYKYQIHEEHMSEAEFEKYISQNRCDFDLHTLPLFEIKYIKIDFTREVLVFRMHHIITDGTSLGIFFEQLKSYYAGEKKSVTVTQYKDYAAFREEQYQAGYFEDDKKYWMEQFKQGVPILELGFSLQPRSIRDYHGESFEYEFPACLGKDMDNIAMRYGYSKFVIAFAAYAILLYKFSHSNQIVIGVPHANRKYAELENSLGMYINTLPLTLYLKEEMKITKLYEMINKSIVEGSDHSGYYSEELLRDLQEKEDVRQLYQAVFIYQNFDMPQLKLGDASFEEQYQSIQYAKTDLTFEMIKSEDGMKLHVEYLRELFRKEDMMFLVKEYERILTHLSKDTERIQNILLLDRLERQKILSICSKKQNEMLFEPFIDMYQRSVNTYRDNIAICDDEKQYTYGELDDKVSLLAQKIEKIASKHSYIGIYMEHGINQIIAILGILKAQCAYLPIDKMHPLERVNYMVSDANCNVLLVDEKLDVGQWYDGLILCVNEILQEQNAISAQHLETKNSNSNEKEIAYMIYTSGSTGQPKGIQVMQKNLTAYIQAFLNEFQLTDQDVMLHQASIGFDASIEEIYPILVVGGCIAVINRKQLINQNYVKKFLIQHKVSILSVSPHFINEINQYWSGTQIHTFIVGSDVLKKEYINRLLQCGKVYNTYGPTETTVCATYYQVKEDDKVIPIGQPILNYQVYILDENEKLCPIGVEGEICISGAGVTMGYVGKDELTKKQFVSNPFVPGQMMYHTRDLGILLPDGNIKYMGRCDNQLNIRGFRIETGEIESHLLAYEDVEYAIVIGKEIEEELCLCAYIKGKSKYTVEELREYLTKSLPEYMIPSYFVNIDEIPLSTGGKVDTKRLPNPQKNILVKSKYVAPENEKEEILCGIWRDVLRIEVVGVNDNFFSLGGQSLKAMQLIGNINDTFAISKTVDFAFMYKTVREQASHIQEDAQNKKQHIPMAEPKECYATSYMQKDMYAVQKMKPDDISYNIVKGFRVKGNLDIMQIRMSVDALMERHEVLRTAFVLKNQDVYQQIYEVVEEPKVSYLQFSGETKEQILKYVNKPFDLSRPGLFHIYVIKEESQVYSLIMVIHHMISDAVSLAILWEEFFSLYEGNILKKVDLTYKDYAEWQVSQISQSVFSEARQFWEKKMDEFPEALMLPYDNGKEEAKEYLGTTYQRTLPNSLVDKVGAYAISYQLTPYMIYIGTFGILLSKLCRQSKFCIGTPVVNRENPELFQVVGVFINTIIQKFELCEEETCLQFLFKIKKNIIEGLQHQEYPYYLLKEDAKRIARAGNSLFNVMFSMIQVETEVFEHLINVKQKLQIEVIDFPSLASMFDLTLELMCTKESVTMNYEYRTDLFSEATIKGIADKYINLLEMILMQPQTQIKDIDISTESEKKELIVMSKGKELPLSYEVVLETIEKQMQRTPENIALYFENQTITYQELQEQMEMLASYLWSREVGESGLIAICMDASISRIVSILAVLKAGYGYLPIDKSWPKKRMEYVLEESGTSVMLTDDSWCKEVIPCKTIIVTSELHFADLERRISRKPILPEDTAYVIYTSGSSGTPKGVVVQHRNLAFYVQAFLDEFSLNCDDVMVHQASIAFDSSIEEIFPILCVGGAIAIASKETIVDRNLFVDFLRNNRVSVMSVSPYLLNELNQVWSGTQIHTFISGGDILRKQYISNLLSCGKVYNTYGPTETTVCATYYQVTGEETANIPIGKPILNSSVFILDEYLHLCPIGTVGEICIAGYGVTKGYLNRVDLNAEKFIEHPLNRREYIYRTGDLGRVLRNGEIEYIGRKDNQINIRGYRVELGEIENRILLYKGVFETIVVYKEENDDAYLCAYIRGARDYTVEEMKKYLGQYLPQYMVPTYYVNMKQMPFSSSGKIDKTKLPVPFEQQIFATEYVEPETEDEKQMSQIWASILGKKKIGKLDDFFDIGGQSLKAIVLCNEIELQLGKRVPTSAIFRYPRLCDFCKHVKYEYETGVSLPLTTLESDTYEASMQQKSIYILQSLSKETTHYNMPAVFRVCGDINVERIEAVILQIIYENPIFRTSFEILDDTIVQRIHEDTTFQVDYFDTQQDTTTFIQNYIQPFNLAETPLIRCGVQKVKKREYIFVIDVHHIISDGESIQCLMEEIFTRYKNQVVNQQKYKYIDYSEWQKDYVHSEAYQEHKEYWLTLYEKLPETLNFPTDFVRPANRSYHGNSVEIHFNGYIKNRAKELTKKLHATNFMLYFAVYSIVLNKYSSQKDIVIGVPTLGRTRKETLSMYGNFVNTLAIRTRIDEKLSFEQYIAYIANELTKAYDYQDVPFHEVIEALPLKPDSSRNPLFDTMFSYLEGNEIQKMDDFDIEQIPLEYKTAKFDFGLDITEEKEQVNCILNYTTDLFEEHTMKSFLHGFGQVLEQVLENPSIQIGDIELLSLAEKEQILEEYNKTDFPFRENRPIIYLMEEQCKKNPDKVAIVYFNQMVSYQELHDKTNAFANMLRCKGIKKGDYVPILMERSVEVVIAIYSIMKLGAIFVPMDVNWPELRITSILEELEAKYLLVNETSYVMGQKIAERIICCNYEQLTGDEAEIREDISLDDSIYVIYTSGSTGKPKGVEVYHRGILNRFLWMNRYFGVNASESVLQTTNHMYDSAVWQFFWPLINGGRTVIPDTKRLLYADYIIETIENNQISMIDFVPSVFNNIVYQLKDVRDISKQLRSLKCVILGGEEIVPKTVYYFQSMLQGIRVFNLYGPTEASIGCICHEVVETDADIIPIGKPIDHVRIYILDKNRHVVPMGVPGEIYIAGECIAKGYLKDEEKTNQVFVQNPFSEEYTIMYKTGDLAKYRSDGEILFLGRADYQVKIRGFRIELGEIEMMIRECEGIENVQVLIQKLSSGEPVICAYVIGSSDEKELKMYLAERLPYYMVPGFIKKLQNFPIAASGKLDRNALPKPEIEIMKEEVFQPENEVEEKLLFIFKELLHITKVNIHLNFFEHGGNSLTATLLVAKINQEFNTNLKVSNVFFESRIQELANMVRQSEKDKKMPVKKAEVALYYEASAAQKRMYVMYRLHPKSLDYNMPMLFKVTKGEIKQEKIQECVLAMVQRHESFRTHFSVVDGILMQHITEKQTIVVEEMNVEGDITCAVRELIKPFDLEQGPLLRVYRLHSSVMDYIFLDLHHIISDGVSIQILMNEIQNVWLGETLTEVAYQYKDFSNWQNEYMKQSEYDQDRRYWLRQFSTLPDELVLSEDAMEKEMIYQGEIVFNKDQKEQIDLVIKEEQMTLYMFFLSVLYTYLYHMTLSEHLVVGTPVSGRTKSEFESTFGLFVNTIVLKADITKDMTFQMLMKQVKEVVIQGMEHQDFSFDDLVDELKINRNINQNPLFNIIFSYENVKTKEMNLGDIQLTSCDIYENNLKFPADVMVREYTDSIVLHMECKGDFMTQEELDLALVYMEQVVKVVQKNQEIKLEKIVLTEDIGYMLEENMEDLHFEFQFE